MPFLSHISLEVVACFRLGEESLDIEALRPFVLADEVKVVGPGVGVHPQGRFRGNLDNQSQVIAFNVFLAVDGEVRNWQLVFEETRFEGGEFFLHGKYYS